MDTPKQDRLFFEDVNDALRDLVNGLGGAKKVGPALWPEKSVEQAQQTLLACFNPDRRERLSPEQLLLLLRKGREAECHAAINYLCEACGYASPAPLNPEDEKAKLQREVVEAARTFKHTAERLEKLMQAPVTLTVVKS